MNIFHERGRKHHSFLFKLSTVFFRCRDSESHDTCDQPGHVHVLGDVPLVRNGNYGELKNVMTCHRVQIHTSVCFIDLFVFTQEAYSVARQFNLIPPVCEQAEYHFFQRDKVETQLPELYHKIGESVQTLPATVHMGGFVLHADAQWSLFPTRRGRGLLVSVSLWNHYREV